MSSPDDPPSDHTPPTNRPEFDSPPTLASTEFDDLTPGAPPGAFSDHTPIAPPGYELLGELGRGGMGVVYRARQVNLNRIVALKMMRAAEYAMEEDIRRFLVEAQAVARLQHKGIVQVFDFGRHAGLPFYTMELIEGGSLHDRALKGPMSPVEAAAYLAQIARAIHHAHEQGITHRDLKPENVLITGDGTPRVTDFGLALISEGSIAERTRTGTIMGTPSYMAPEQAAGKTRQIGPCSDIYSLGAILYRLLVGRPPFLAASAHEIMLQVITDDPPAPSRINPSIPRDLGTIALKCLEKDGSRRYPSAAALADDLERWLRHEPIVARPVGPTERAIKWVRRNRVVAALLSAIALALIAGTVVSTVLAIKAYDAADAADKRASEANDERQKANGERLKANDARKQAEEERRLTARQRDRAEAIIYGTQLTAAHREWLAGNVPAAWRHLIAARWDMRGLEYRLLHNLFTRDFVRLDEHTAGVTAVAVSPNGSLLASCDQNRQVLLLNALTGKRVRTLCTHDERPECVAFSPDGRTVASAGLDGVIKLIEVATGQEQRTLTGHRDAVRGLAFSPDGSLLASVSRDGTVRLWQTAGKGVALLTPILKDESAPALVGDGDGSLNCIAFSPDGQHLAIGGSSTLQLWSVPGRKVVRTFINADVTCVAFSPDGKQLVSGVGQQLHTWEVSSGKQSLTLEGHTERVRGVAYRPDGLYLVSCGDDRTVIRWRGATPEAKLKGHRGAVLAVAVSPDGRRIISGGEDRGIHVWDGRDTESVLSGWKSHDHVTALEFSPDGTLLASSGKDRVILIRQSATGDRVHELRGHTGEVDCLAFAPDSKRCVSGGEDRVLRFWDLTTGKTLGRPVTGHTDRVTAVAYSNDGTRILSASWDSSVRLWDADGKPIRILAGHECQVRSVAFSPDDKQAASCDADGTILLWDLEGGVLRKRINAHEEAVNSVAYSSDGAHLVSASDDSTLKVWDVKTGEEKARLQGHAAAVQSGAFFPDDTQLMVISGGKDGTVRLWNVLAGVPMLSLEMGADFGEVNRVAAHRRGWRIAAGGSEGRVRTWETEAEADRLPLVNPYRAGVTKVTASADDESIHGQDDEGRLLTWDANTGRLLSRTWKAFPEGQPRLAMTEDRELVLAGNELSIVLAGQRGAAVRRAQERLMALARPDETWHRESATDAFGFALVWHLDRLSNDRAGLAWREQKLAEAHSVDRDEAHTLVALCRHAVCDANCRFTRRRLLPALKSLAEQTRSVVATRTLAGLYLRAGAAEEALAILQPLSTGAVEELLRSLAQHQLGKFEQARQHLAQARSAKTRHGDPFERIERERLLVEAERALR